jgi:hypothetical protein
VIKTAKSIKIPPKRKEKKRKEREGKGKMGWLQAW